MKIRRPEEPNGQQSHRPKALVQSEPLATADEQKVIEPDPSTVEAPSLIEEINDWSVRAMAAGGHVAEANAEFDKGQQLWQQLADAGFRAEERTVQYPLVAQLAKQMAELAEVVHPELVTQFAQAELAVGHLLANELKIADSVDEPSLSQLMPPQLADTQDPGDRPESGRSGEPPRSDPIRAAAEHAETLGDTGGINPPRPPSTSLGHHHGDEPPEERFERWFAEVQAVPASPGSAVISARYRVAYPNPSIRRGLTPADPADLAERGIAELMVHADAILHPLGDLIGTREHPLAAWSELRDNITVRYASENAEIENRVNGLLQQVETVGPLTIATLEALRDRIVPTLAPQHWDGAQARPGTRTSAALAAINTTLAALTEQRYETAQGPLGDEHLTEQSRAEFAMTWADILLDVRDNLAPVTHLAMENRGSNPVGVEVAQAAQSLFFRGDRQPGDELMREALRDVELAPLIVDRCQRPGSADEAPRLVFVPVRLLPTVDDDPSFADQRHFVETGLAWVDELVKERLADEQKLNPDGGDVASQSGRRGRSGISAAHDALMRARSAAMAAKSTADLADVRNHLMDYHHDLLDVRVVGVPEWEQHVQLNLVYGDPLVVASDLLTADEELMAICGDLDPWHSGPGATRIEVIKLLAGVTAACGDAISADWAIYRGFDLEGQNEFSRRVAIFRSLAKVTMGRIEQLRAAVAVADGGELAALKDFIQRRAEYLRPDPESAQGSPRGPAAAAGHSFAPLGMVLTSAQAQLGDIEAQCSQALSTVLAAAQTEPGEFGARLSSDASVLAAMTRAEVTLDEFLTRVMPRFGPTQLNEVEDPRWRAAVDSLSAWQQQLGSTASAVRELSAETSPDHQREVIRLCRATLGDQQFRRVTAPFAALALQLQGYSPEGLEAAHGGEDSFLLRGSGLGTEIQHQVAARTEYQPLILESGIVLVPRRYLDTGIDQEEFVTRGVRASRYWLNAALAQQRDKIFQLSEQLSRSLDESEWGQHMEALTRLRALFGHQLATRDILQTADSRVTPLSDSGFNDELRICNDAFFQTNFGGLMESAQPPIPEVGQRRVTTDLSDPLALATQLHVALERMYAANQTCGQTNAAPLLAAALPLATAAGQRLRDRDHDVNDERGFVELANALLQRFGEVRDIELSVPYRDQMQLFVETLQYQRDQFDEGGNPASPNVHGRDPSGSASPAGTGEQDDSGSADHDDASSTRRYFPGGLPPDSHRQPTGVTSRLRGAVSYGWPMASTHHRIT